MSFTERSTVVQPPYSPELMQATHNLFRATIDLLAASPLAKAIAHSMLQKYTEHAARTRDGAALLGVDPADAMLANLSYDLPLSTMACSTLALATPEGPMIARNMDWFPPGLIAKASAVVPIEHGLTAGFLGSVGVVTGLSNRGFGLALNAASNGESDFTGYPMLLFLRHVLDHARDYSEALTLIRETPLMLGGLITLVGTKNEERAVVERTPHSAKVRFAIAGEALIATNHYRLHSSIPACSRYDWMSAHADTGMAPMKLLTNANVLQSITSQHVIVRPATRTLQLFLPTHLLDPNFRDEAASFAEMFGLDVQA